MTEHGGVASISGTAGEPAALRPCTLEELRVLRYTEDLAGSADPGPVSPRRRQVLRRLSRLDVLYGAPLTEQTPFDVRLTPLGRRLLTASWAYHDSVEAAVEAVFGDGGGESERDGLVVATCHPVSDDVVDDFAGRAHGPLAVHYATPTDAVASYDAYRVDAVNAWWLSEPEDYVLRSGRAHVLREDVLGVRLPAAHPRADAAEISLADLADELWMSDFGPDGEPVVSRVFRDAGLAPPANLRTTAVASVVRSAGVRGEALTLASLEDARPAVESRLLPLSERPVRVLALLADPQRVHEDVATDFVEAHVRHGASRREAGRGEGQRHRPSRERGRGDGVHELTRPVRRPAGEGAAALNLEAVAVLRAIARYGSINRAAGPLSLSQPALTRKVQRLEQALGAGLLLRSRRGTTLTAPARAVLRHIEAADRRFRDMVAGAPLPEQPGRPDLR